MRAHVRSFCAAAVAAFGAADPIVEFGSFLVDGQRAFADLRPLFPGARYIGCDARAGPGVDRIEDIAATQFDEEFAGTVLCLDTLEHVFRVSDACAEMHRVLKPGGLLVAATVMRFPIHEHPDDYWRLTPSCLNRLSSAFPFRIIGSQGVETFPHTVFAVAIKAPVPGDAAERADRFIRDFTAHLDAARRQLPLGTRIRRALRATYRSRGERRELVDEYTARFSVNG